MNLTTLLHQINTSQITLDEIPQARQQLEEEIFQCDEVIKDQETEWHMRNEYRETRRKCLAALERIK